MKPVLLKVPALLLADRELTSTAKLLWMVIQLCARSDHAPIRPGLLEARSGLSRHTVLAGLSQLQGSGWSGTQAEAQQGSAVLPSDLLLDMRVKPLGKLVYGALQLTPASRWPAGEFTYSGLARLTGTLPAALRRAVSQLQEQGWAETEPKGKFDPIKYRLLNPASARREAETAAARVRLKENNFSGEALMREYLSLIVASDQYEDNSTPGFLINPFTGQEMEFDRFYPPGVAFEYNGPQHYRTTSRYPSDSKLRKQQARDYMKQGISTARGIQLVVVQYEDLTLEGMCKKVGSLLPVRDLDDHGPLAAYLKSVSGAYRCHAHS